MGIWGISVGVGGPVSKNWPGIGKPGWSRVIGSVVITGWPSTISPLILPPSALTLSASVCGGLLGQGPGLLHLPGEDDLGADLVERGDARRLVLELADEEAAAQ